MKMIAARLIPALVALVSTISCRTSCEPRSSHLEVAVVPLAKSRYALMQSIADKRGIPIPREFHQIMNDATSAEWVAVSHGYEHIWRRSHWFESDEPQEPRFVNELWHPLHETYWTFKYLMAWPQELVHDYCDTILTSLPANGLVFTGSDSTRFLLGSLSPGFGRSDIAFISQNALADNTYMNYVQDTYGETLWIPNEQQRLAAFTRYVECVKEGSIQPYGVTITNGAVSLDGIAGVMRINGFLAEMIARSNSSSRRIFVDEAYVIPWMTPCLKPHGLLMELLPAPITNISAREAVADMDFWNSIEYRLAATYDFTDSEWSGQAYAMMRSAIAGIYAYHGLYEEAETAFRQAMRIAPSFPAPSFRLATQVLAPQGRTQEAEELLQELKARFPDNARYEQYIQQIKNMQ